MLNRQNTCLVPSAGWDIDRLFRDVFADSPGWVATPRAARFPAVNAWEDEGAYHVEAELPGYQEKDLEITLLGKELRLSGKREDKAPEAGKVTHRERSRGDFTRVLRFPADLDDSKIDAKLSQGILTVTLPKAASALPRKIRVQG